MKRGGRVNAQSTKRRALAPARRHFVRDHLHAYPRCQVRWDGGCTGRAEHVHEALMRSRGGVIVPTPGVAQLFVSVCWWCHAQLHAHPEEATARGFLWDGHSRGQRAAAVVVDDPPPPMPADRLAATQARIRDTAKRYGL